MTDARSFRRASGYNPAIVCSENPLCTDFLHCYLCCNERKIKSVRAEMSKKIIIIAGPNGAGKTTFARSFLPDEADCTRFINADLIAAGLSPFAPETAAIKAGRLMLNEIRSCVQGGESFAFETTLSGLGYLQHIRQWQEQGYQVSLYFLSLPDAEFAIARVAERVRQGGHTIPEAVIRRRFNAGLRNFERNYRAIVNDWALYDNTGIKPVLLEWGENI
jgi:predicted ABC-type ATPase